MLVAAAAVVVLGMMARSLAASRVHWRKARCNKDRFLKILFSLHTAEFNHACHLRAFKVWVRTPRPLDLADARH